MAEEKSQEEQLPGTSETAQEIPEIEPGTSEEYAKFLLENKDYSFSYILKLLREKGSKPPYENYAVKWRENPKSAADYIATYFPDGKGKKEFVEALRKPQEIPETKTRDPDFHSAYQVLNKIIDQLAARESYYHTARQERVEKMNKEGAVSDTLRESLGNLVTNFRNGSAMDKAITIAAIGIGIKILMTLKDKKFPFFKDEKFTWWSAGKWLLGGWAVNEVSRRVSKDGKSLMQRITNMGLPVENLQTCLWGAFALDGKKENQEIIDPNETKQMLMFADKDMRPILKVYEREYGKRQTFTAEELEDMGFSPDEIKRLDGKTAFKIVDKLVKRVGRNYFPKIRQQEIEAGRLGEGTPENQIDYGKFGILAVKEKYTEGPLASHTWTFEEIMTEEYIELARDEKMIDELYADYEKTKLPAKVKSAAVAAIATLKGIGEGIRGEKKETEEEEAREKGKEIGEKIREGGKKIKGKFDKATDAVKKKIRKILHLENDEDFLDKLKQVDDKVRSEIRELLKKRGVSTSVIPPPKPSTGTIPPP